MLAKHLGRVENIYSRLILAQAVKCVVPGFYLLLFMQSDSDIASGIGDTCPINYQLLKRLIKKSDEGFVNLAKELDWDRGVKNINLSQLTKPNRTAFNLKRNDRGFDVKDVCQFWKVTLWVANHKSCTSTENSPSSENVAIYDGQQSTSDITMAFGGTPLSKTCGRSGGDGPLHARPTAGCPNKLPAQGPGGPGGPGRPPLVDLAGLPLVDLSNNIIHPKDCLVYVDP